MDELRKVLDGLSEETLWRFGQVVNSQARRMGLRRMAGKESSDLEALLEMSRLLASVHRRKLLEQVAPAPEPEF